MENSPLEERRYVGFWVRTLASIIDTIVIVICTVPVIIFTMKDTIDTNGPPQLPLQAELILDFSVAIAVILFWKFKSATPGKMLFNAIITDAKTGGPPSTKQLIIRYLGYIPSTLFLFMGFFWIAFDKKKQGWHDKLADTVVEKPSSFPTTYLHKTQPSVIKKMVAESASNPPKQIPPSDDSVTYMLNGVPVSKKK
ncbi:MAG: RDD family protein [Magnetococcales bacterium]|nr:RDD family protein [Magnetococcales bacterium]